MSTNELSLVVDTGDPFDIRHFDIHEGLHELFAIEIVAVSNDPAIDFDRIAGRGAQVTLQRDPSAPMRRWHGIVTSIRRVAIEADHLTTYRLTIRPELWLLTQTRNYRVFQHMSEVEIACRILGDWGITPRRELASSYPGRKYRVQYAESDYRFMCRLLEDAGITFNLAEGPAGTELVLTDAPQAAGARARALDFSHAPLGGPFREIATQVELERRVRPGRYTQRDVDYRRQPETPLSASALRGTEVEARLERFHHNYGAFLFCGESDGSTPFADDRGAARTSLQLGTRQVERRLAAKRHDAQRCQFLTTAHDLAPGVVFGFAGYPTPDLGDDVRLLVVAGRLSGEVNGEWRHDVEAVFADHPYHPPLSTPKPRTLGVESATVVGPEDEEIHTDELGRVRVQFHWDREGQRDDASSCWIPVSQPWGGAGFGALSLPRVGQEVLVDFLGADPDRPVIVGRVFTKTQPVPYELPKYKTVTGMRSQSAYRYVMGAADGPAPSPVSDGVVSPLTMPRGSGTPLSFGQLEETLKGETNAWSPNTEAHRWNGSELTFDDRFGREVFYMQAERDMNAVVRNCMHTVVGNSRDATVGTDDHLEVKCDQLVVVGANRCVSVEGEQVHQVTGDIHQQSVNGSQYFDSCEAYESTAKHHKLESGESLTLVVGKSTLFMRPDFVILQSPHLFLNPGEDALTAAIEDGQRPLTPEEAFDAWRDSAPERAKAAIESAYQNGEVPTSDQLRKLIQDNKIANPLDDHTAWEQAAEAFHNQYGHIDGRGVPPWDTALSAPYPKPGGSLP